MLLGSIEAGGTKFVCAVGNINYQIQDSIHIPTTTPEETIQKKDAVLGTLEAFLDDNEYKSRPQYKKSKNKLMRCAAMQVHFESRSLIYRRPETIWVQSKSV